MGNELVLLRIETLYFGRQVNSPKVTRIDSAIITQAQLKHKQIFFDNALRLR